MKYRKFEEAKLIIHNLKIKSVKEYYSFFKEGKIPVGIPRNPNRDYVEFTNWPDFLGNGNVAAKDKPFLSYEDCREYLINEGVDSKDKFETWRKLKLNNLVPARPDKTYKNEWESWGVFFKTNRIADVAKHQNFLNYQEAKEYLSQFNFHSEEDFYSWAMIIYQLHLEKHMEKVLFPWEIFWEMETSELKIGQLTKTIKQ